MSESCPSTNQLQRLLSGCLAETQAESMMAHVDGCSLCQAMVEQLDTADPLLTELEQLRDASTGSLGRADPWRDDVSPAAVSIPSADLSLPIEIGPYRLVSRIAVGGMGTVYEARHRRLGKPFALKLLHTGQQVSPALAARIRQEWKTHGRLTHPNIVDATDAGIVDGMPYLVTERIDGVDLSRLVAQHGPLDPADACELVRQAALGLHHAHSQGIVHGDVKPSNVMLQRSGTVKVLDLGTASWHDCDPVSTTGAVHGTLAYMAPEQFDGLSNGQPQSDIYALGCTLYFLLTGNPPFGNPNDVSKRALVAAHRTEFPRQLIAALPQGTLVPAGLQQLLERSLAKRPADRLAAMDQFAAALAPVCTTHRVAELAADLPRERSIDSDDFGKSTGMTSLLIRSKTRRPRWMLPMALTATAIMGIIAGALYFRSFNRGDASFDSVDATMLKTDSAPPEDTIGRQSWNTPEERIAARGASVWAAQQRVGKIDGLVLSPARIGGGQAWQIDTIAPRGAVTDLGWSSDGQFLAATSADGHLRIWRWQANRLELVQLVTRRDRNFKQLAWHPNRPWIAASSTVGICLIDARDGSIMIQSDPLIGTGHLDWHPDGQQLAVATSGSVALVEVPEDLRSQRAVTGRQASLKVLDLTPALNVMHFDWSPAADSLVLVSPIAVIRVAVANQKFAEQPEITRRLIVGQPQGLICCLPGGQQVAVMRRHLIELLDARTLETQATIRSRQVASFDFRSDGQGITGFQAGVGLFDASGGSEQHTFSGQQRGRPLVAWHPSGRFLTVGINGMVAVLNSQLDEIVRLGGNNLIAGSRGIDDGGSCVVTQNGKVAVVRPDGSLAHFESVSRGSQRTIVGFTMVEPGLRLFMRQAIGERFEIRVPASSPSSIVDRGERLADRPLIASISNELMRYDGETQTWEHLMRNPGQADGVELSPDGSELICLDYDGTVKFVSLASRQETRRWNTDLLSGANSLLCHDASGKIIMTGIARENGQPVMLGVDASSGEVLWEVADPSLGPQVWCVPTDEQSFVNSGQPFQLRDVNNGHLIREVELAQQVGLSHYRVERSEHSDRFQSWSGRAAELASDASATVIAWDAHSLKPIYLTLGVGDQDWLTLTPAGQIIDATPAATEQLVWLLETPTGVQLQTHQQFHQAATLPSHAP